MGGVLDGVNFSIAVTGIVICSLGLALSLFNYPTKLDSRGYLVAIFAVLLVYISCDLFGQVGDDLEGHAWVAADRIALFVESALPSLAVLILTALQLSVCKRDWRSSLAFRIAGTLWLIYIVLLVQTQFTGNLYQIDDNNVYQRGPHYSFLLVPMLLIEALDFFLLWRDRDMLSAKQRAAFTSYLAIPAVSMAWQMAHYGLLATVLGSALGALSMLWFIMSDQTDRYRKREEEVIKLRTEVMLNQIQPHFLFNTLDTIYGLVDEDPKVAKKAIESFSRYLRANLASLKQANPIPVDLELKHVHNYLELERMSDESRIDYEIDAQATGFLVPPLSIQTLAENAVKHGLGRLESGGKVTIRTYEQEGEYIVAVTDNGIGFDTEALDGAVGIGISNTQERVSALCGGTLEITSKPGQGTSVIMHIPGRPTEATLIGD